MSQVYTDIGFGCVRNGAVTVVSKQICFHPTGGEADQELAAAMKHSEIKRPVLVLAETKDQSDSSDRYRTLLPDELQCSSMMQVAPIGAARPEALAYIALEFFERRDLFLVSRESGMAFP